MCLLNETAAERTRDGKGKKVEETERARKGKVSDILLVRERKRM